MAETEELTLPDAIDHLYRAVGAFIDPVKELVAGRLMAGPSAYEALVGQIPAKSSGDSFSRGVGRSLPPVWCDAVDLRVQIDRRTKQMQPEGVSTPGRLRGLASRRWRPQDCRQVSDYAAEIESWRISVQSLLEPERVRPVAASCPACNTRWVYRNNGFENVRVPALQLIVDQGCSCRNCHASWTPDRYVWLCQLLKLELPAGVLE